MGLKTQVIPVEQVGVILPPKPLAAEADIVKVADAVPTGTVTALLVAASEKTEMPFPDRVTDCGLPLALSAMLKVPARAPLDVGWKMTLIVQTWPTFRIFKVVPQVLVCTKSPEAEIWEMLRTEVPVLVRVTV